MKIKAGYNDRTTHIRFDVSAGSDRVAGLWIEQEGLEDPTNPKRGSETLAYITLDELLDLQAEVKAVIQELVA